MTADKYCYYLRNPSQIVEVPFEELYNLVLQYPYCQSLRFLLLKKAQQENRVDFENLLETAASYSIDRKYLYRLVNQEKNSSTFGEDDLLAPDFLELKDISTEEMIEEKILIGSDLTDTESGVDAGSSKLGNISFNLGNPVEELGVGKIVDVVNEEENFEIENEEILNDDASSDIEIEPETVEANLAPSEVEEEEIIDTEEVNQLFEEDPKEEDLPEEAIEEIPPKDLIIEQSGIKPENDDLLSLLAKYSKENKVVKRIRRSKKKVKLADQKDPMNDDEPAGEVSSDDIENADETIVQEESKQPLVPTIEEEIIPVEDEILEIETLVDDSIAPINEEGELDTSAPNEKTQMEEPNKTPKSSKPASSFEEVLEQMLKEDIQLVPALPEKKTKKKKNRKKKKKSEKIFEFSKLKVNHKTELQKEDIVTPEEVKIFDELKASIEDLKKKKTGKASKSDATTIKKKKKKKDSKKKEDLKKQKAKKKRSKKKGKKDDEVVIRLARKSIKKNDDAVSETLARLLAEQGHKDMAILMYERLGLIFPKKSAFFAAEIKKLKNNKK